MFTKITIKAIDPAGWPIDFELDPQPGASAAAIDFLEKHGYKPAPSGEAPRAFQELPGGSILCPKHDVPMKKREKQGDVWYSHTITDTHGHELYCRGHAGKSSPGWNVDN